MRKFGSILVLLMVAMLLLQERAVYAQDTAIDSFLIEKAISDDPLAGRAEGEVVEGFYDDESIGCPSWRMRSIPSGYTHNARFDGYNILNGIDVSVYQGDINWNAVKAEGIDFVIVRVGYRGYGDAGTMREDANFRRNIEGALAAGLKVGVYMFSQAITTQEAVEEANFLLSRISGYNITFPVVMDFEYASTSSGEGGRLYNANLSRQQATEVCKGFCYTVSNAGYTPMVYANKSMLRNHLNASEISAIADIWLANYATQTDYEGEFKCWQYTSGGYVNGISGRVDMDFWYELPSTKYNGKDYSAVYDFEYYISHYDDMYDLYRNNPDGAIEHFVEHGMSEGRQASEEFNVYTYRNRYADLRSGYGSDLKGYYLHYIDYGKSEERSGTGTAYVTETVTVYKGVDYSAVYDLAYYMAHHDDLRAVYANDDYAALEHFVEHGMAEGRQASEEFNVYSYKNRYADLRSGYRNDLKGYYMHYVNYGKAEGRIGTGADTMMGYTTVYQGIDYASVYDFDYYMANHEDLRNVYSDDDYAALEHFVEHGMSEGRQASEEFNVYTYRNRYADLRKGYGSDLKGCYMHYVMYGKQEGRSGAGFSFIIDSDTVYEGVDYSSVYNYEYYITHYDDMYQLYVYDEAGALQHFVEHGMAEGRRANEEFNVYAYMNRYEDLRYGYSDDLKGYFMHYVEHGKAEGRYGGDVRNDGISYEGIDYSAVYNFEYYMAYHADLNFVYGNDPIAALEHFVNHGMAEGRQANESFNVYAYRNRYEDLHYGYGEDLKGYYMHYVEHGEAEGRSGRW